MSDLAAAETPTPERTQPQTFSKHQLLLREGQQVSVAYMVKRGKVLVFRVVNNRKVVVDEAGPGQFVAVHNVLTGRPFHANAEAADFTEVLPLDAKVLTGLMLQSPNPVQRLVRCMADRLAHLEQFVRDQTTPNMLLAVCQVVELCHKAAVGPNPPRSRDGKGPAMSTLELCRAIRSTLLIPQTEIDLIFEGLANINQIEISEVKQAKFKKNIFGEMEKSGELLQDRTMRLVDPDNFMNVARNLAKEEEKSGKPPFTRQMAFMDLGEFAQAVEAEEQVIHKKLSGGEFPSDLFFLERSAAMDWARKKGDDFFKKAKRKRLNTDALECVDDIGMVDDKCLQDVFSRLGFRKLAILFAAANNGTKQKMENNMSSKIAGVVKEEAAHMEVSELELGEVEAEMIDMIKAMKKPAR